MAIKLANVNHDQTLWGDLANTTRASIYVWHSSSSKSILYTTVWANVLIRWWSIISKQRRVARATTTAFGSFSEKAFMIIAIWAISQLYIFFPTHNSLDVSAGGKKLGVKILETREMSCLLTFGSFFLFCGSRVSKLSRFFSSSMLYDAQGTLDEALSV